MFIEYRDPVLAYLTRNKSDGEDVRCFLDRKGIPSFVDDINKMVKDSGW